MPRNDLSAVVRYLRRVAGDPTAQELTDKRLLDRYLSYQDHDAFAMLVRRHGSLVRSVVGNVLHHVHDADDAFQATILVFASKAACALELSRTAAAAMVGPALRDRTIEAALSFAAGKAVGGELVSGKVAVLAKGVLHGMLVTKLKITMALVLAVGLSASAVAMAFAPKWSDAKPGGDTQPTRTARQPSPNVGKQPHNDNYGDPLPAGALARLGTVRFRHEGKAAQLVYSPDSKILAGLIQGSGILVWDAASGKELYRLSGGAQDKYGAFDISPDGNILAAAPIGSRVAVKNAKDGLVPNDELTLWELRTGKKLAAVSLSAVDKTKTNYLHLTRLRFSPDGKHLALIRNNSGSVDVWEIEAGKVVAQMKEGVIGSNAYDFAFSTDGKVLAVACFRNTTNHPLQLWDVATGKLIRELEYTKSNSPGNTGGHTINAIAFSPDGKALAFQTSENVFFIDPAAGKQLRKWESDVKLASGATALLAFSPDGKTLYSAGKVGKIRMWDVATGKSTETTDWPRTIEDAPLNSLALSPDRKTVAAGGARQAIRFWDLTTGKEKFADYQAHDSEIRSLAFSPDGKILASSGKFKETRLWDTRDWKQSGFLPVFTRSLAFSPDSRRLAAGGADTYGLLGSELVADKVCIWSLGSLGEMATIKVSDVQIIESVTFSADGRKLITLDRFFANTGIVYHVRRWDAATLKQEGVWNVPKGADLRLVLPALANSTSSETVSAGFEIAMHDLEWNPFTLLRSQVATMSPDGRALATAPTLAPFDITLWEDLTCKPMATLKGHEQRVTIMAWSADGRVVASADREDQLKKPPLLPSTNQTIRVWDIATRKEMARFSDFNGNITTLAVSPDGAFLAAGLMDSTILIWKVGKKIPKLAPQKLDSKQLDTLWADLAGDDADKAHQAAWTLIAAPQQSVSSLQRLVNPVPVVNGAKIQQWIAELDSDKYTIRQTATKELDIVCDQAKPALEKALKGKVSLEARQRMEQILKAIKVPTADTLQELRAIRVLETIGSPEARSLLKTLAGGAEGARVTVEAQSALVRCERRLVRKD